MPTRSITWGHALTELGRLGEAAAYLRQAIRLKPAMAQAHNNLGLALAELGRFAEAEAAYEAALAIDPKMPEALTNLGSALKEQGRVDEAITTYQVALWVDPESASAQWNRALARLQSGDYERGWPEYEWRWRRKHAPPRRGNAQPLWNGSDLAGRTILLTAEQGLGDVVQFVRYAPLVKARGGSVLVECPPSLIPLLRSCGGIDGLVAESVQPPAHDVQAPLMSLPAILGTTLESVPRSVPYLSADPALVEDWRSALAGHREFRVGIAWQGNPRHKWDRHRSFRLSDAAPLARLRGVRLYSLQRIHGLDQLSKCAASLSVETFGPDIDTTRGAFMDTAATMKNLELVVVPDSALAHVAGALGVPVWVPLGTPSDCRWMMDREDSPWYPTMRLFRQSERGAWGPVFARMAEELTRLASPGLPPKADRRLEDSESVPFLIQARSPVRRPEPCPHCCKIRSPWPASITRPATWRVRRCCIAGSCGWIPG
jgi:hypothetical protein